MMQYKSKYYEIRLESIGGLGANLCGKLLGELGAIYLGLNASSFSSYGSEKRGSPVKANIRWCDTNQEIRINSPVQRPDLLGIFHEAMIGRHPVLLGTNEESRIVINTALQSEAMAEGIQKAGGRFGVLYCVDCQSIARKCKSRINMVMLGALVKAAELENLEPLQKMIEETMGKKYPDSLQNNLEAMYRGYEAATAYVIKNGRAEDISGFAPGAEKDADFKPTEYWATDAPKWGYRTAPIGGVITQFGSTVSNDLSASRQGVIPLFHPERCIHCGMCDITCPDMVFQFREGVYKGRKTRINGGLDYHHCKGCLRCVSICPVEALTKAEEWDFPDDKKPYFVRNQELIAEHIDFDCVGANSWVTSDSYLTEKNAGE